MSTNLCAMVEYMRAMKHLDMNCVGCYLPVTRAFHMKHRDLGL